MHELSVAQSLFSIIEHSVPKNSKGTVTEVHLIVGTLSAIELDALTFSFDIIKENTIASQAKLIVNSIQGKGKCKSCGTVFPINNFGTSCPDCNQFNIDILEGKELKITSISMEE